MQWESVRWQMPLEARPVVAQMGVGVHGKAPVENYRLGSLWCIHFYDYSAELVVNKVCYPIRPGYVSVFPPNVPLQYRYRGRSVHRYAHFSLGRRGGHRWSIPAMQDLGADFAELNHAFEVAVGCYPSQRLRAEVRLWDILWQLATRAVEEAPARLHPAVQEAVRLIELRLAGVVYVPGLAREVGLSPTHLTRLFKAGVGMPVAAYIRDRRVQRARHLLRHSTLPIKAIATQVGIPDLHLFNKTIRRALGSAPRRLRSGRVPFPARRPQET